MKVTVFFSIEELEKLLPKGENKRIKWNKSSYLVWRNYEDEYFLTEIFCPHQSYSLNGIKLGIASRIVCPWHGYSFDKKSGHEKEFRCKNLTIIPLYREKDQLVVFDVS